MVGYLDGKPWNFAGTTLRTASAELSTVPYPFDLKLAGRVALELNSMTDALALVDLVACWRNWPDRMRATPIAQARTVQKRQCLGSLKQPPGFLGGCVDCVACALPAR